MAARKESRLKTQHREAIKTSMLINRLNDHALGKVEMTATQVRAAEALIRKTLPDLKASEDILRVEGITNLSVTFPDGNE